MTEMSEVMACLSDLFFMLRISVRKRKLSDCVILNMSRRMSYSTRLLRSYGAICRALTRSESRISMTPYMYFYCRCCSSLALCYFITD
jgi:hypothetical protein